MFQYLRLSLAVASVALAFDCLAVSTETKLLSGTGLDDTVDWEFRVNGGRRSGEWSTIPVPSNWEMQGFGTYHYWKDWGEQEAADSLGEYRHAFEIPEDWSGRRVKIVFGGAMTDTVVRVNGKQAGAVHQGGFYEFSYDITDLVRFGEKNELEVDVRKFSDNLSVNEAERESDFWLFGGIYRPVWLEALPQQNISRVAIDAKGDGRFAAHLDLSDENEATAARIKILDKKFGRRIASTVTPITAGATTVVVETNVSGALAWSAESPHLYVAEIELLSGRKIIHERSETFGFRTIEVRAKDGIYVNGRRVVLKGSNRHTIWPTSGRTTNASLSRQDILLMKEMNMNAVRMSHYPPERHFLEAADELGIYVIDELTGWQKAYDEEVGAKLVRELVIRDVNHPSIILWANGNEGGWNRALDDDFTDYDPQQRTVIHPWLNTNGINTSHYETYDTGANFMFHGDDIIMPTEFLHALYDGGGAAGLDDWWRLIWNHPLAGGGFLWAFADEGVVRDDQDGKIDVVGNSAPDGIVGPYREKEGSFFAIKEIWSPVYLPLSERDRLPPSFDGRMRVENRYDHTNLREVKLLWELKQFADDQSEVTKGQGEAARIDLAPRLTGMVDLGLPRNWAENDLLEVAAMGPDGKEIYRWTWMLSTPADLVPSLVKGEAHSVQLEESGAGIVATIGDSRYVFDKENGRLLEASRDGRAYPLSNGPVLIGHETAAKSVEYEMKEGQGIVRAVYEGPLQSVTWTILPSGWLQLDYSFKLGQHEKTEYVGVSFDYPEEEVTGVKYLGKGPYRVWKNRRKGVEYGVWEKAYNDTATGASWVYPEFKGFHEDLYWATLQSSDTPMTIVSGTEDLFLRLFTPKEGPDPRTTHVDFPEGDLSFLQGIAPIGTKFHAAAEHGPEGALNLVRRHGQTFSGTLFFRLD